MAVNAQTLFEEASALHSAGRLADAAAAYRRSLEIDPRQPRALANLGHALRDQGKLEEAIGVYRRALGVQANQIGALNGMGTALRLLKRYDESVAAYRAAIEIEPNLLQAHHNLGVTLLEKGDRRQAVACLMRASQLGPPAQETFSRLIQGLGELGENAAALETAQSAAGHWPDCADFYAELGRFLFLTDHVEESIAAYRRAVELDGGFYAAHNNLGNSLRQLGRFEEAKEQFARALAIQPDFAAAHWNMALLRLLEGDLPGAWEEYEWRWKVPEVSFKHDLKQPRWDGSDPAGRRILLHAEQGFGDTLHFARYIPLVAERGAEVILTCQAELVWLMKSVRGVKECVAIGQPLPEFDVHCSLMSLPNVFKTTLETIPAEVPYVRADAERSARWRRRLEGDGRKKVGLFWHGNRLPDLNRSARLSDWAELGQAWNVRWISLQKGDGGLDAKTLPPGMKVDDWTSELVDFSDTAALMDCLDLVITIDSAAAHLAGALGKPVWLMLPQVPTWRWMRERSDSPWYPTMRIFRQDTLGDWSGPVRGVVDGLNLDR